MLCGTLVGFSVNIRKIWLLGSQFELPERCLVVPVLSILANEEVSDASVSALTERLAQPRPLRTFGGAICTEDAGDNLHSKRKQLSDLNGGGLVVTPPAIGERSPLFRLNVSALVKLLSVGEEP